jgi:hypothetical protein
LLNTNLASEISEYTAPFVVQIDNQVCERTGAQTAYFILSVTPDEQTTIIFIIIHITYQKLKL